MSERIIIDVQPIKENNKVSVKEMTKQYKYSKKFTTELKSFISLTMKWFESFVKIFFYGLVVIGCWFQEFGKKQRKNLDNEKQNEKKLF